MHLKKYNPLIHSSFLEMCDGTALTVGDKSFLVSALATRHVLISDRLLI